MRFENFSGITRSLDIGYPTNVAIVILSGVIVVAGTGFQFLGGVLWFSALFWGIQAGLGVFFAWALARELDPDHDLSAFVAAGLAIVGVAIIGPSNILTTLWLLFLLRLINRSTGLPATGIDSLAILLLAGWLTQSENWIYGLATTLALFLDAWLPQPNTRQWFFGGLALSGTIFWFASTGSLISPTQFSLEFILPVIMISLLFIPVIFAARRLTSLSDRTNAPLNPIRLRATQVIALLAGLQLAFWEALPGWITVLSLWAALLGTSLFRVFFYLKHRQEMRSSP